MSQGYRDQHMASGERAHVRAEVDRLVGAELAEAERLPRQVELRVASGE
ncbi:MAG: hypothetical protein WB866_04570 [Solirubrobacterales bacterium]